MRRVLLLFTFGIFNISFSCAQVCDSPDTLAFYKDLYQYSKHKKALFLMYQAFFNVPHDPVKNQYTVAADLPKDNWDSLECKSIRSIRIVSLEPFGTNVFDTTLHERSLAQKTGNAFHRRTRKAIISNYLLFKVGDPFDILSIHESERLLRQTKFIREAKIRIDVPPDSPDSIDVVVYTQDIWSISPGFTLTSSRFSLILRDFNFMGVGHDIRSRWDYRFKEGPEQKMNFENYYLVPNIENTFISAKMIYNRSGDNEFKQLYFERPFYSALTEWAGGAGLTLRDIKDSLPEEPGVYSKYQYSQLETDAWTGKSFMLRKGRSVEERTSRLIVSGRYTGIYYPMLHTTSGISNIAFPTVHRYLASVGWSTRKYFTDRYIFDYGDIEDVPVGRILEFTGGLERRTGTTYKYTSIRGGMSNYIGEIGYVYSGASYSTFFSPLTASRGIINMQLGYISPLLNCGKGWNLRIYAGSYMTLGVRRFPFETINLAVDNGLPGYRISSPSGTQRFVFNYRAVLFNPIDFIGFRFSPIVFAGLGMIGDEQSPLLKSKVYQAYGIGMLVNNVYLVNSSFKLVIRIYPVLPEGNHSEIMVNPFSLADFGFRDYDIGKPGIQSFQ